MKKFAKNAKKYIIFFCFSCFFCAAAFAVTAASPVLASSLPAELGMWRLVSGHVTELTASEELGKWEAASYVRSGPPGRIEVQLTEGTGPGALFVPEGTISSDGGPIGFSSAYETISVAGRRAVLEHDSVTGQALAVDIGTDALGPRTVTFEARGISKEELIDFAESMIEAQRD